MAAADYYLKIDGVQGESEAVGFEDQIQVASWSWGASNSGSSGLGGGAGTGKAAMSDFNFVCENGKATPQLFLNCAKGTHIPTAELTCRKTGGSGEPYTYYKMKFNDIVISSFNEGGSGGGDMLPMVQISFNYTKVTQEYFKQKPDGSVSLTNTVNFDVKKVQGSGA